MRQSLTITTLNLKQSEKATGPQDNYNWILAIALGCLIDKRKEEERKFYFISKQGTQISFVFKKWFSGIKYNMGTCIQ